MKKLNYLWICFFLSVLTACSSRTEWEGPLPPPATTSSNMPAMPAPEKAPPSSAETSSKVEVNEGTVIDIVEVPETKMTYLELENNGKKFWIATAGLTVAKGNKVQYDLNEGVVMTNFTSRALNRTFEQILLVANAQVVK